MFSIHHVACNYVLLYSNNDFIHRLTDHHNFNSHDLMRHLQVFHTKQAMFFNHKVHWYMAFQNLVRKYINHLGFKVLVYGMFEI